MKLKLVLNTSFGGYGLSKEAYKYLGLEWTKENEMCDSGCAFEEDRTNPKLVECVETLGEKASAPYSQLEVVEFNISDHIKDFDGKEWI